MIIDFSVTNYLSIKDEMTLSFVAETKINKDDPLTVPIENGKYNIYSFAAIYGPNASGKTNLIKALIDFKKLVLFSNKRNQDDLLWEYRPFKLAKETIDRPTIFEIEFFAGDNKRYNYLIEFNKENIFREELFFFPEGRKATLFKRDKQKIKYGGYFTGEKKILETLLLPNKLFLSVVANSNNNILAPVFQFFSRDIEIHEQMDSSKRPFHKTTFQLDQESQKYKNLLIKILQSADLSLEDIVLRKLDGKINLEIPENIPDKIKDQIMDDFEKRFGKRPFFGHKIFENGMETDQIEFFNLESEESTGTIKMYDISGEIIDALQFGKTLVVDEFNSGLHPSLNQFLIELFLDPVINKNSAQLLITTHDTCILDAEILKREQIWFTDKKDDNSTDLYSLDEFDKNIVREKSKYTKMYLDGRFRGIPLLNYKKLFSGFLDA